MIQFVTESTETARLRRADTENFSVGAAKPRRFRVFRDEKCALALRVSASLCVLCVLTAFAGEPDADRFAFANALAKRGMWQEAAEEYQALTNSPAATIPRDEAVFRLADACRHVSRLDEAKACYRRVFTDWPKSRWSDLARLNAFSLETDRTVRLNELKSLDRDDVAPDIRQLALYRIGEMFEGSVVLPDGRVGAAGGVKDAFLRAFRIDENSRTGALAALKYASLAAATPADADTVAEVCGKVAESPAATEPEVRAEALYLGAMALFRAGRWDAAAERFSRLHRDAANTARDADARQPRALSLLRTGRFEDAFEAAKDLGDGDETGLYIRIAALSQMSRPVDCRKLCREYLAKFPTGAYAPNAAMILIALSAAEKRHVDVVATVSARGDWPESIAAAAYGYACDAALALKDWQKTADFAEKLRKCADDAGNSTLAARALYLQGVAFRRMDDSAAARRAWTDSLKADPDGEWAEKALAARAAEELKSGEALAASRSYEELFRRFPDNSRSGEALYRRALALLAAKDNLAAESVLRLLIAQTDGGAEGALSLDLARDAKMRLATILLDAGKTAESSELLAAITETSTEAATPAGIFALQAQADLDEGRTDAALALAKAAVRRAQADPETDPTIAQGAWHTLGAAHQAKGERDAAMDAWRKALEIPANTIFRVQSLLALGRAESEAGNFGRAEELLLDAVEKAGDDALLDLRMDAYVSLAENARRRSDDHAELRYCMILLSLFNDDTRVPPAIDRAAELLRGMGKNALADNLLAEKEARYGR